MPCTTILAGKCATYDGSTFISRNDDSGSGKYVPTKWVVVHPDEQPKIYNSVISHVSIKLPKNPMRYTAVPHALHDNGIWAASGVAISTRRNARITSPSSPSRASSTR